MLVFICIKLKTALTDLTKGFFISIEMTTSKDTHVSISKFVDAVKEHLTGIKLLNLYFDNWYLSKYYDGNYSVKFVGCATIDNDGNCKWLSYKDIHNCLPDMTYIKFQQSKTRNMKALGMSKKLCKLVIEVAESVFEETGKTTEDAIRITYHKSAVVGNCNQKLLRELTKRLHDEKAEIADESTDMNDQFIYDDIDPDCI